MADALRADAVGCYDGPFNTPHLDALARRGVRFKNAFAQTSWTRDSIAGVFTGHYHWTHGVIRGRDALSPHVDTLAELLRSAGYRTGAIVGNPNIAPGFKLDRGFEDYVEMYKADGRLKPGPLLTNAQEVVDEAIAWIGRRADEPFFLFVLAIDPHAPYMPAPPYDTQYQPGNKRDIVDGSRGTGAVQPDIDRMWALYGGEVSYLDEHFGRLLAELARLNVENRTVVVFTADHGEEFREHGGLTHGASLFEEVVRVPLIVSQPRCKRSGYVVDNLVELRDLFPTILEWANVTIPREVSAQSLAGCFVEQCPVRKHAFAALRMRKHHIQMVRGSRFKLLHYPSEKRLVLYDLAADPGETVDVSDANRRTAAAYLKRFDHVRRNALALSKGGARAPTPISREIEEALRALGYLQ